MSNTREKHYWVKGTPGFWVQAALPFVVILAVSGFGLCIGLFAGVSLAQPETRSFLFQTVGAVTEMMVLILGWPLIIAVASLSGLTIFYTIRTFFESFYLTAADHREWHLKEQQWRKAYGAWKQRMLDAWKKGEDFDEPSPNRPW